MEKTKSKLGFDKAIADRVMSVISKHNELYGFKSIPAAVVAQTYMEEAGFLERYIDDEGKLRYKYEDEIVEGVNIPNLITYLVNIKGLQVVTRKPNKKDNQLFHSIIRMYNKAWENTLEKEDCPGCDGKGKTKITMKYPMDDSKPDVESEIDCIHCQGEAKIPSSKAARIRAELKYEHDMMCECEDSDMSKWKYHPDGEGEWIHKHHYTCFECGKVTQIG